MKKTILLSFLFAFITGLGAQPNFVVGKKYAIQCDYYQSGSVSLGAYHDVLPFVYYMSEEDIPDDGDWYIDKDEEGYYTFKNALSMQYLVYDSQRVELQKKGLNLASSASSLSAKWNIQPLDAGGYFIQSVENPSQYFNLRVDGTNLVGTYAGYNSSNGVFTFVDVDGKEVEGGSSDTSTDFGQPIEGESGVTQDGYYWERTGLVNLPFVASTSSDPILYKIRNVRSGKYLVNKEDKLYQNSEDGTRFYFR
jgi:hypothetical protein